MDAEQSLVFPPVLVSTLSGLASAGDTISKQGHIDVSSFALGGHEFQVPEGLSYDVALTNAGEGVLATGLVRATAQTTCDRCLDPATVDIAGEVSCYYLHDEPEPSEDDEDDDSDEDIGLIGPDGDIDLAPAIQSAIAMDVPYVVLCREDCKGLCPTCGCNLNHETCDCAQRRSPADDPMNPFAKLADLVIDEPADGDDRS